MDIGAIEAPTAQEQSTQKALTRPRFLLGKEKWSQASSLEPESQSFHLKIGHQTLSVLNPGNILFRAGASKWCSGGELGGPSCDSQPMQVPRCDPDVQKQPSYLGSIWDASRGHPWLCLGYHVVPGIEPWLDDCSHAVFIVL